MSERNLTKLTLIIIILPLDEAIKFLGISESLLTTKLKPFTYNNETYVELII